MGLRRWWRKRRIKWSNMIEAKLKTMLHEQAGKLISEKVAPRLDGLVADRMITPEAKTKVIAGLSAELVMATPKWADDITDQIRKLMRVPDDD